MLIQLRQVNKMGSLGGILKMIPGMSQMAGQIDEVKASNNLKKTEAMILSMTQEERNDPSILRASRKSRIAKGSGVQVSDVNKLIKQFEQSKQAMKMLSQMQKGGMPNMNAMNQMMRSTRMNQGPKLKTRGRRR